MKFYLNSESYPYNNINLDLEKSESQFYMTYICHIYDIYAHIIKTYYILHIIYSKTRYM